MAGAAHGAQVQVHGRPLRQRRGIGEQMQTYVDALGGLAQACVHDPVAARDGLLGDACQVQRAALAGHPPLAGLVLRMDAAHAHGRAAGRMHEAVAYGHLAIEDRARHHRALAGQAEDPVHRQAEQPALGARGHGLGLLVQVLAQRPDARIIGQRGCGFKDGRIGQVAARQNGADLVPHLIDAGAGHAVYLGQRHRALADAQQLQYFQMLQGLGHHAVIGGHHQQGMVNAHGPCGHRVHKFFMAGHIDDAQHIAIGQRGVGVAQLDRDAARLFFLQAVRLHAGERAHQRGLAMVDVACGADDHG